MVTMDNNDEAEKLAFSSPPHNRPQLDTSGSSSSGGRTRSTRRKYVAESETLTSIAHEAEERLAAKRKDRAERRELRLKEIQRKQQLEDVKEKLHNGTVEEIPVVRVSQSASPSPTSDPVHTAAIRPVVEVTHLKDPGQTVSTERRGSDGGSSADEDSRTVPLSQYREIRKALASSEEKWRKCLLRNQHLDNEKTSLNYTVDLFQDKLEELTERWIENERLLKAKSRELESARRDNKALERNVTVLRQQLQQREDLVREHGLVLVGGEIVEEVVKGTCDGGEEGPFAFRLAPAAIIQRHTAALLDKSAGTEGTLDARLRRFAAEKEELRESVRRLQLELDAAMTSSPDNSSHHRSSINSLALDELETLTREERKKLEECKIKLEKTEIELLTAEGSAQRLEQQVRRYKELLEASERVEDELKTDKRKLTRELREAKGQVEELTNANKHLQTRLDKIRAVRGVLQNELNKPL